MSDQFIQVPPQSTGLKIDCTELTVGANTVERERQNLADPTDAAGLAKVLNAAPAGTEYALVTRNIPGGTQAVSGTVTATQTTGSNLHVVVDTAPTTTVTGTVAATQSTSPWVNNLTQVASTALGATAIVNYGSTPAAVAVPAVNAFVTNTVPVTGTFFQGTQPVSGTVTANQGTANTKANAWTTELTDGTNGPAAVKAASTAAIATDPALVVAVSPNNSVAVTGTFFQGTQPVSGTVTANQGTANTAANSWQVEVTDGTNVLGVSAHPLRVDPTGTTTQPVSGTVTVGNASLAVTQSTSPWVENVTQLASTALGVPQTFGTAPTGVVIGTSSDLYVAGTRARSNQTTTAAGVQDVNVAGIIGVTAVAAAAGIQKVGISGNAAATLDSAISAATAPTNALATSAVFQSTIPALTAGQAVAAQCDTTGSHFVNNEGRKATYSAATGATATAGTGVVLQITGSATKTVRITRIHVDGFAAAAAQATFKLQRTSVAATAGTSAALTAGKLDTNNAAATAVITHWTATGGTTGTTVGGPLISDSVWLQSSTFAAAVSNEATIEWGFNQFGSAQLCTLRGTSDLMTLTCSGTLAASQVWVEWTEE